jgi:hypothetical protein
LITHRGAARAGSGPPFCARGKTGERFAAIGHSELHAEAKR